MRDGPWWKKQYLHLSMRRPLIPLDSWALMADSELWCEDNTLAVIVHSFGAQQQAIVRRLMGDEVYARWRRD